MRTYFLLLAFAVELIMPSIEVRGQPVPDRLFFPAFIEKETILCRAARLVARQAGDLFPALVDLGLTTEAADDYLHHFQADINSCEDSLTKEIAPIATLPYPLDNAFGKAAFLELLWQYREALQAQCGATDTFALIVPDKATFDELLNERPYGTCSPDAARGTASGTLPQVPSLTMSDRQCLLEAAALAVSPCPSNPMAEAPTIAGGTEADTDEEWKKGTISTTRTETKPDGSTETTKTYNGLNKGNTQELIEITTTDKDGNVIQFERLIIVKNNNDRTNTVIEESFDSDGNLTNQKVTVSDKDGNLVVSFHCEVTMKDCGTTFGPAHPTNKSIFKDVAEKAAKAGVLLKELTDFYFRIKGKKMCVHFPGSGDSPLYYKDDIGVEIDTFSMVSGCLCQARASRCPLCPPLPGCESAEDRQRRACLRNPYGPGPDPTSPRPPPPDAPRPECLAYLREDNPSVDLDAKLCQAVMCSNTSSDRFATITTNKVLGCGCYSALGAGAPQDPVQGACGYMYCEQGQCGCQWVDGKQLCGCVSPTPLIGSGSPPPRPVVLGLPIPSVPPIGPGPIGPGPFLPGPVGPPAPGPNIPPGPR